MDLYSLWFDSVKLSGKLKESLVENFQSVEELWYYVKNTKVNFNMKILERLQQNMDLDKFKPVLQCIEKNNIKYATIQSPEYPKMLKNFEDSPYGIYYFGDLNNLNETIAVSIVGSRLCSDYGREVARRISSDLSKYNINIISGMAKGIDSEAHWGCLNSGGTTTAVLGCGLDKIYPAENKKLYDRIKEKGCIISEFLPGTPPFAFNFPIRNRIISGLSDLIIIVEASERSGSLITASRALDQGKQVMAVPGSVFSEKSKETNKLIRDGAYVFTGIESVLELLKISDKQEKKNKRVICSSKEMKKVYSILTDTPMHVDDIIRITNIDISLIYELLLEMQLEDNIKCIAGSYYVKVSENF